MLSLKKVGTLALAAVGLAASQSQACPTAPQATPDGTDASERHPLVAGLANPAGIALAGTAGIVGLTRMGLRRGRTLAAASAGAGRGTTAAFDYPGGEEW